MWVDQDESASEESELLTEEGELSVTPEGGVYLVGVTKSIIFCTVVKNKQKCTFLCAHFPLNRSPAFSCFARME